MGKAGGINKLYVPIYAEQGVMETADKAWKISLFITFDLEGATLFQTNITIFWNFPSCHLFTHIITIYHCIIKAQKAKTLSGYSLTLYSW